MTTALTPIDLDVVDAWPVDVRDAVEGIIEDRPDFDDVEYSDEVELTADEREVIDAAVNGVPLLCYHATRLLPHEVESIRANGLLPLTPDLVTHRLEAAVSTGRIDAGVASRLLPAALKYAIDDGRKDQVCLIGSRLSLRSRPGFWRLFTFWGGEAIYWDLADDAPNLDLGILRTVGSAAVVVAALPSGGPRHRLHNLDLPRRLVAIKLGLECGLETHVDRVDASEVLDVILEGSPAWIELDPMSIP